ncbi:hypothetical protein DV737_g3102, partial [Chaetothyriales sp. CBS 132003]
MHILLVNDDGPPSNQSSPYVHALAVTLQSHGHQVSVVLPNVQRSWIGKAHMVGQNLTPSYFRPGTLLKDDGIESARPFTDGGEEWILLDGTPASCVGIGLHHLFNHRGPVDLVLSGPNYGRNTTAVFALSSGTLGAAMEGAILGTRSIALSYAFDSREHDLELIKEASELSTRLVEKLVKEWPDDVHVYSINVPLRKGVIHTKILYAEMIQNRWVSGSTYDEMPEDTGNADPAKEEHNIRESEELNRQAPPAKTGIRNHVTYKWAPKFAGVRKWVEQCGKGDGWEILQGNVTVTPLRANFWPLPQYTGEIKLDVESTLQAPADVNASITQFSAVADYPDPYVQKLLLRALKRLGPSVNIVASSDQLNSADSPFLQFTAYEALNFDHAMSHPSTSLICAYTIRKALIRKHYLSNTVATWLVKHPESPLASHFKPSTHFELDFADFLEEALVDAWDLNSSLSKNQQVVEDEQKEWWILKPGMSDGANGLRLFSTFDQLQAIFEEWEIDKIDEDDNDDDEDDNNDDEDDNNDEEDNHNDGKDGHNDDKDGHNDDKDGHSNDEDGHGNDEDDHNNDNNDDYADGYDSNKLSGGTYGTMISQLRHFVAQPYIARPLLLPGYGNRKFHIRTYVLASGALKVYVYREMLALFAAKPYTLPGVGADGLDLSVHLTNTCFQEEATKSTSVYRFWALESKDQPHGWKDDIFSQICSVTGEVFEAAAREQMVHFQAIPNAFEIFGADFLIDEHLQVYLLEFNAYPDFKQTGHELQDIVIGGLFDEVVDAAIAPFFSQTKEPHRPNSESRMPLVKELDLGRH